MNIPNKDSIKKLLVFKGSDAQKMEITPFRDWMIVVCIFFVALAISIGFNIYMSIEINRDNFFTTETKVVGAVKFNTEGLAKVVSMIDGKAARFEGVRTATTTMVDPSL